MRLGRVTPELDVLITEPVSSGSDAGSYRVRLFRDHPGNKVRVARLLLRTAEKHSWGHLLAAPVLWACREELAETIMACDLDGLNVTGASWGPALRRVLAGRFPPGFLGDPEGPVGEAVSRRTPLPSALVSIVLPVYNVGRYLHQSVESCLGQSHRNLELLVVDDGSTVDVAGALGRCDDERLRLLEHPENRGIAAALNTGFAAATGDFLTWTSDDNYYDSRAIETMLAFLIAHDADFVYADMFITDERDVGQPSEIRGAKPPAWFRTQESNPVGACFLYRRRVYDALGPYDPAAFLVEDYEYWLRVAKRFRMHRMCRPLYYYRYHPKTLTATYDRREVLARLRRVRRQHRTGAW